MKLYSWNVNGIRAVAQKGFTEWVEAAQPDILCLQAVSYTHLDVYKRQALIFAHRETHHHGNSFGTEFISGRHNNLHTGNV